MHSASIGTSKNAGYFTANYPGDSDVPAIIDARGASPIFYSPNDIDKLANCVAMGLAALEVSAGSHIAILSDNRVEVIAVILGAMRAGLVAVPINHRLPADSVRLILQHSNCVAIFCEADKLPALTAFSSQRIYFDDNTECGFLHFLKPGIPCVAVDLEQPALLLYTGGSTGAPKGVLISHKALIWTSCIRASDVHRAAERYLIAAPLCHLNGLAVVQLALWTRNTAVLLPNFTPKSFVSAIETFACTQLTGVPTMFATILAHKRLLDETNLSSVRAIRLGSEAASNSLLRKIKERFPGVEVTLRYGATELGPIVFSKPEGGLSSMEVEQDSSFVGQPHPQINLKLLDSDGNESDEGTLVVKSPGMTMGYFGDTKSCNSFTVDGFFITGDQFRRDENGYYFVGRTDDMFKVAAEKVYPRDIESHLEKCPGVAQVAAVPVDNSLVGTVVGVFIVKQSHADLSRSDVEMFARVRMAEHQVPCHVWFVTDLPMNLTNKLDRLKLRAMAKALVS